MAPGRESTKREWAIRCDHEVDHSAPDGHEGPLAEFNALREEIVARDRNMIQLFVFNVTAASAIFGIALTKEANKGILLVVPLLSYTVLARYMAQNNALYDAAVYIANNLRGLIPGGVCWEGWLDRNRQKDRLLVWLIPLFLAFLGVQVIGQLSMWSPVIYQNFGELAFKIAWFGNWLIVTLSVVLIFNRKAYYARNKVILAPLLYQRR